MNRIGVFISHRSIDKTVADILQDFLIAVGVSREAIFCSSLPGSDVKQKISVEIKDALNSSRLNIVILSNDYYTSPYCLNEAGVLWFLDTMVIPIALPEINQDNMVGFLNSDYIIKRMDNQEDLSSLVDRLLELDLLVPPTKATVVLTESNKAISRFNDYIKKREKETTVSIDKKSCYTPFTDDEAIVFYFFVSNKIRKASYGTIEKWLYENEIYEVNVENAFDLISTSGIGCIDGNILSLNINEFRDIISFQKPYLDSFKKVVEKHTHYGATTFLDYWSHERFADPELLFISYIIDEKMNCFASRWMTEKQIANIKNWESKNYLTPLVSQNYGACLELFFKNRWVYPDEYTSSGNPRTFRLHNSIQRLLFENTSNFASQLQTVKDNNIESLPF